MCCIEGIGNFDGKRKKGVHFKRLARNTVLEGHSLKKFHHNKRLVFVSADFVDSADVRMIKRRCRPSFATESLESLPVAGYVFGQELESNKPAEFEVFGLEHHTHTAAAQLLNDAVVRDGLADHRESEPNLTLRKRAKSKRAVCESGHRDWRARRPNSKRIGMTWKRPGLIVPVSDRGM